MEKPFNAVFALKSRPFAKVRNPPGFDDFLILNCLEVFFQ